MKKRLYVYVTESSDGATVRFETYNNVDEEMLSSPTIKGIAAGVKAKLFMLHSSGAGAVWISLSPPGQMKSLPNAEPSEYCHELSKEQRDEFWKAYVIRPPAP